MFQDTILRVKTPSIPNATLIYHFKLNANIEIRERYPDNIVTALSKIGGIKALLGLGLLMVSLIHERLFE